MQHTSKCFCDTTVYSINASRPEPRQSIKIHRSILAMLTSLAIAATDQKPGTVRFRNRASGWPPR